MQNKELLIRIQKENLEKSIENFSNKSLEERVKYINELIMMNDDNYRRWFYLLKQISTKTIQINKLKKFYESLDNIVKKEFQTELYEIINNYEWDWKWDDNIDDSDKLLKPLYNLDTIDSNLEKIKIKAFQKNIHNNYEYHEKLLTLLINRCSEIIIKDFKKSIEDYILLMKINLSNSTKKKLFSLPAHMRIYAFMEMYNTAKSWNFEDWYLRDNYDNRQRIRKRKKQQVNNQIQNPKGYIKKKYSLIKPRYKKK